MSDFGLAKASVKHASSFCLINKIISYAPNKTSIQPQSWFLVVTIFTPWVLHEGHYEEYYYHVLGLLYVK